MKTQNNQAKLTRLIAYLSVAIYEWCPTRGGKKTAFDIAKWLSGVVNKKGDTGLSKVKVRKADLPEAKTLHPTWVLTGWISITNYLESPDFRKSEEWWMLEDLLCSAIQNLPDWEEAEFEWDWTEED